MPKGIYPRKPRVPKQDAPALVVAVRDLYGSGLTQAEVADRLHLSQKSIFGVMRRNGIAARVAAKREQRGDRNSSWKGDDATYAAFHYRLYAKFGKPAKCSACGTETAEHYDYANLAGNYADIDDYAPMCRSCHWKRDGKASNFSKRKEGCHA